MRREAKSIRLFACLCLCLWAATSAARNRRLTDQALVSGADVIVSAGVIRLRDSAETIRGGRPAQVVATIWVYDVLKGKVKQYHEIEVLTNKPDGVKDGTTYLIEGWTYLLFLRSRPDSTPALQTFPDYNGAIRMHHEEIRLFLAAASRIREIQQSLQAASEQE